jgi:hypothetical protein
MRFGFRPQIRDHYRYDWPHPTRDWIDLSIICDFSDDPPAVRPLAETMLAALIEQVEREDLDPEDLAEAIRRIEEVFSSNLEILRRIAHFYSYETISLPQVDIYRLISGYLQRWENQIIQRVFEAIFVSTPANVDNTIRADALFWVKLACHEWVNGQHGLDNRLELPWHQWLAKRGISD